MESKTYHDIELLRAKLVKTYESSSPTEKAIVQLMSVIYEPITRTAFQGALNKSKIRKDDGRAFGQTEGPEVLKSLLKKGLVENHQNSYWRCPPLLAEVATREALRAGRFEEMAAAGESVVPVEDRWGYYYFHNFEQAVRAVRLQLYRRDIEKLWQVMNKTFQYYEYECGRGHPLLRICNNPFDAEWFATLPDEVTEPAIWTILSNSFDGLTPSRDAFAYLEQNWSRNKDSHLRRSYRALLVNHCIWRGQIEKAAELIRPQDGIDDLVDRAAICLVKGDVEPALGDYEEALAQIRKITGKRKGGFLGHDGVFYMLAVLQTRDATRLQNAADYLNRVMRDSKASYKPGCAALSDLVESYLGIPPGQNLVKPLFAWSDGYPALDILIKALVIYWMDATRPAFLMDTLLELHVRAEEAGYDWLAAETAELIARFDPERTEHARKAAAFHARTGTHPLADVIHRQEAWERNLDALEHVAETTKAAPGTSDSRLTWSVQLIGVNWRIEPREVKRLRSGAWSKGKVVSLKRLCTDRDQFPYLTPQDVAVCSHIAPEIERSSYYSTRTYYDLPPRAMLALVGHPMVFLDNGPRVEVVKGEPELRVAQKGDHVLIELAPPLDQDQDVAVVKETYTRLKVIECRSEHRRMAGIIKSGLRVPAQHKARVLEALSRVASMITVHSDIGGGLENVPEVPADPRPHVILLPSGEGLRVQILVQPLTQGGTYYRPGVGGGTVMAEVDGKPVQTRRDLEQEKALTTRTVAACPTLDRAAEYDGEWMVEDPEDCLELIEELQDLADAAVVEWPEGRKMNVRYRASFANLQLKVASDRNWFEATGQLRLDQDRVLDMRQLLELLDQARGRFVPIGEGQFLSLTKEFRKRLDELRAVSEEHGKGVRFHPLAAPAIENLLDGAGSFKADKAWKDQIERFREAQAFEPALPSTLRAELRDYQVEGYQWLARLARWGAGACLADDMGLGKTVEALTLILAHASEGPALVIAPTSVCMNWIEETQRFAPTLRPIAFGPGNRQGTLDALKPFDLLVCSYGLLHQEEEKLAAIRWRVAVLDEAQAIKNVATRRSQAAMNLQADFRLITTGTPIENHLGELWNLFRFINPGLLGSLEQFARRFSVPIEKHHNREAKLRLKKLIQPFILRRIKEQVLEELPSRTEILLHVEFTEEETAFYEALRQQAVQKIAQTSGPPAQKHLRILAEIMRLRRACCNPQLVAPEINVPSSKLAVFLGLVDELIENRHKALVFSQFVDHLRILRKQLDARGVAYQYLDGSSPPRDRKRSVDAFQAGEGDLFLISLKAGGLGLNLTAADYVIHMDPWWNPAVEDQASDRAHRIGQQRPVTIYRLVTKDTIESKIVDLHRYKRDLADSLLEGSDMAGRMSADELLALLHEGL